MVFLYAFPILCGFFLRKEKQLFFSAKKVYIV